MDNRSNPMATKDIPCLKNAILRMDCDTSNDPNFVPSQMDHIQVSEDFSKRQLFRHESELKDKKGGYLQGKVKFPSGEGTILINCAPPNGTLAYEQPLDFQPNLLLVSKMNRSQKRRRISNGSAGGLSPDSTQVTETKILPEMWRIQLKQTDSGDIYYGDTLVGSDSTLFFDSTSFPVTIMVPLQGDKDYDKVNIKRVLQSIDDSQEFQRHASILEHQFKRKGKFSLHEVRLRFKIKFEDDRRPNVIGFSENILNQKHSSTVSLEIKMCLPHHPFCNHESGKMYIMLVSKVDAVDATLVIMDGGEENQNLTKLLNQPPKPVIYHKVMIEVVIPPQIESINALLIDETSSSSQLHLVLKSRDERKYVPLRYGKFNPCKVCNQINDSVVQDLIIASQARICGDGHKRPTLPIGLKLECAQPLTPPPSSPYEPSLHRVVDAQRDSPPETNFENEVSWMMAVMPTCLLLLMFFFLQKYLTG